MNLSVSPMMLDTRAAMGMLALHSQKTSVGIGVLSWSGDEPQTLSLAAFFVSGCASMGGRAGEPQGSLVLHQYANPVRSLTSIGVVVGGSKTALEHTMSSITAVVTPVVSLVDGQPVTTSQNIAEVFGKAHDDVLRRIRTLNCSPEFTARNFAASDYTDSTGRTLPAYQLTRDGCAFLVMGFTGKKAAAFKEAYIEAFNAMEAALRSTAAQTITPAQQRSLQEIVARKAGADDKAFRQLWGALKSRFHVAKYDQLPQTQFDAACDFLMAFRMDHPAISPDYRSRPQWAEGKTITDAYALIEQMRNELDGVNLSYGNRVVLDDGLYALRRTLSHVWAEMDEAHTAIAAASSYLKRGKGPERVRSLNQVKVAA